jgi:hypothetical protein
VKEAPGNDQQKEIVAIEAREFVPVHIVVKNSSYDILKHSK